MNNYTTDRTLSSRSYIENNYTTDRMVVVAVGAVDHEKLVEMSGRLFQDFRQVPRDQAKGLEFLARKQSSEEDPTWSHETRRSPPTGTWRGSPLPAHKPKFCGAELLYRSTDIAAVSSSDPSDASAVSPSTGSPPSLAPADDICHFAVAWEGVDWCSPDVVSFMLMQAIFGSFRKDESQKLLAATFAGNPVVKSVANRLDKQLLEVLLKVDVDKAVRAAAEAAAAAAESGVEDGSGGQASKEFTVGLRPISTVSEMELLSDEDLLAFQEDRYRMLGPDFRPASCEQFSAFNTCYKVGGLGCVWTGRLINKLYTARRAPMYTQTPLHP